ncbi:hypothetical protein AC1031_004267 [Aphanomyces cochlioides]|nr:hypothetical protein AC1031_004267 [Aphanomyces cochlioides]
MGTGIKTKLKQELAHQDTLPLESMDDIKEKMPTLHSKSQSMKIRLRIYSIESAVKRPGGEFGKWVNLIDIDADNEDLAMLEKLPLRTKQTFLFRLTVFNNMCDKIVSWNVKGIVSVEARSLQKYAGNCCQGTLTAILNHTSNTKLAPKSVSTCFQAKSPPSTEYQDATNQEPHGTNMFDTKEDSQDSSLQETDGSQDAPKISPQVMSTRSTNIKKRLSANDADAKPVKRFLKNQE